MFIRNYGLFWRRDWIYFGAGPISGHLKGVPINAVTGDPVDFRNQQGVYCLYDDSFRLVYVGQAGNGVTRLFTRLGQHRKDYLSERWTKFSWFGVRAVNANGKLHAEIVAAHPNIPEVLDGLEAILIAAAEPVYNRQGGKFGKAQQYLQWRDEENLGPDAEEMIRDIWKRTKGKDLA